MKCPLILSETYFDGKETQSIMCDCLKEECAWWDSTAKKCAILQLTYELDEIHCWLEKLAEKLPHVGQVTK